MNFGLAAIHSFLQCALTSSCVCCGCAVVRQCNLPLFPHLSFSRTFLFFSFASLTFSRSHYFFLQLSSPPFLLTLPVSSISTTNSVSFKITNNGYPRLCRICCLVGLEQRPTAHRKCGRPPCRARYLGHQTHRASTSPC